MEGALKLKEISYIHAEAYAAGELKHGPLALVDEDMPVIAVAPNDRLIDKLKSNLEEVRARGGELYVFVDETVAHGLDAAHVVTLPACGEIAAPVVSTLPLQLLSYYVGAAQGHRRGPAAQPGQVGDGGVSRAAACWPPLLLEVVVQPRPRGGQGVALQEVDAQVPQPRHRVDAAHVVDDQAAAALAPGRHQRGERAAA